MQQTIHGVVQTVILHIPVLLMKSFHTRRSLFLITGSHHNPHDFRDYSSLVHQLPIKIFLLNSQKSGQMRQSNLPPLLHPPKVGGLLSRNLARKCCFKFTKICLPICFVFLPGNISLFPSPSAMSERFNNCHGHNHHHSDHRHPQKLHCNLTSISLENSHICLFQFLILFSKYLHHHHYHTV